MPDHKQDKSKLSDWGEELPLIPLRNMVVFPQMIVPLFIGRSKSVKALEETLAKEKIVVFTSQKNEEVEEPGPKDLCSIGTLSEIVQMLSLPDGTTKVLVEGICRVKIEKYISEAPYFRAAISRLPESEEVSAEAEVLVRGVIKQFEEYVKLNRRIPPETLMSIVNVDNPGRLADLISSYLSLKVDEKQAILEALTAEKRLKKLAEILTKEIEVLGVEKKLQGKVRKQIEKVQKEYYLKEKLRAIQEELGEEEGESEPEIAEYKKKIADAKLPPVVKEKAQKELERLGQMPPMAAESSVIRTYLDWIVELPWKKKTKTKLDIGEVERILNEEHFGLEKVKERILEYFAVLQLTGKMGGTILCLVGPPGVGKTSVARSIASAMGRKFTRVALGGVRDEAEVRGHRRTYVGSMPGRIIQSIHKAGVSNPVFLLDEIDKLGTDYRGDPAAALLEVLDPEMNKEFSDHYLELEFDLSDVFFITTANTREPVPRPLQDRMEIIEMSGYTEEEKLGIAKGYLIPREMEKHGLKKEQVELKEEALLTIVREYTREAGVRNLEREIGTVLRKIATKIVKEKNTEKFVVTKAALQDYLGAIRYHYGLAEEADQVGTATGLVWTEVGGDITPVEVTTMTGRGALTLTGQLGDVMQESAKAAISYVRSKAKILGLDENFYRKIDIHIHVPEGAVPKDGPSAGITIATALVSALTGIPVRKDVAMTGEVTLRGKVLPIGGLKEKLLGARRAGIKSVIIPKENKTDLDEIKKEIPSDMMVVLVKEMEEVIDIALTSKIKPRTKEAEVKPYRYLPGDQPPQLYA
ncbi:endopeptidase La [candidate division WOR-1 bacterium RIFOXYA12_FULL_52_29]|uniref:Lon protease n=1 Tax=candidate division WOR-1 bacterium RIFOXYC12_FULL_54_18 TaxID=1802584 RepID=A0A1F4T7V5_UNCSA|nr:MAG: endopeptidase La [candidate division WOR-1 bacterium RIFOXYA2_FULL_51_19]OGC18203.1 MAG: endopeptidase La [candidate division WOR-1 bacterium RIFOXYA12_FULL_52_29]OGC27058.1 MAG: endopeptidase La [candidate division WOR-1 bacterium RIFOXYB2_FULL_45_9]OGC28620.1 MAG: endopeptidase La [candidate division WOR-1 bacterium RIFOXYC12_FULL_54_18]OGC30925.1 MAG: endopeptidase La [candidate division WOR-1 bacterium RIFOXYB12_FULL_52_16]